MIQIRAEARALATIYQRPSRSHRGAESKRAQRTALKLLSWARRSGAGRRLERPATGTSDHRARQLLAILADPAAPEADKDDAAMDLEFLPGPLVEPSLVRTIREEGYSSVLAQVCAESLAGIWAREDRIDPEFLGELTGPARDEVIGILSARAPISSRSTRDVVVKDLWIRTTLLTVKPVAQDATNGSGTALRRDAAKRPHPS